MPSRCCCFSISRSRNGRTRSAHQGASLFAQRDPMAHLGGGLGLNQCQVELAHGKRFRLLPETCLS